MRLAPFAVVCSLVVALPLTSLAAPEPAKKSVRKEHVLPKEKDAAVITLDFKGGFTPPKISEKPNLTIYADGTLKMPAKFQGQKSYDGKLTPAELQELLDFAIDQQKFFEYDEKKVQEKIAAQGEPLFRVADAPVTEIRINADGKQKEFSRYALGMGQGVEELKQMHAIQLHLMRVMATVQAGGKEKVQEYLKRANEKLAEKFPKVKPFTIEDFSSASDGPEGSKHVQFIRNIQDAQGNMTAFTNVSINDQANGKSDVQVNHNEPEKK